MVSSIGVAEAAVDLVQVDGVVGLVAVARRIVDPGDAVLLAGRSTIRPPTARRLVSRRQLPAGPRQPEPDCSWHTGRAAGPHQPATPPPRRRLAAHQLVVTVVSDHAAGGAILSAAHCTAHSPAHRCASKCWVRSPILPPQTGPAGPASRRPGCRRVGAGPGPGRGPGGRRAAGGLTQSPGSRSRRPSHRRLASTRSSLRCSCGFSKLCSRDRRRDGARPGRLKES